MMRIIEIFEKRVNKKAKGTEIPNQRNFVAKHAQTSGSGYHTPSKYNRKEKHKKDFMVDNIL